MSRAAGHIGGSDFRVLWTAAAVSNLGDGLRLAALPLLATTITRDPTQIAVVTAAIWLPWLLLGLQAGAVVDRADKALLVRDVQLARLVVAATLGVLVILEAGSIAVICAAAFLIGAGEVLVENAMQSLVPRTVGRGDLERANSQLIVAETAGNELLGPPLGAWLFLGAAAAPFLVDAATYGCSAIATARLSRRLPPHAGAAPTRRLTGEVVDGLRWLWRHPFLRALTVWGGVFNIGSSAAYAVLVLLVLDVLDVSDRGYGVLLGIVALGGIGGTVVAPVLARRLGRGRTILLGAVGSGLANTAVGLVEDAAVATACLVLASAAGITVNVVGRTLRQRMIPDHLLGRVTASSRVVVYGTMPLGAVLGGWIAATLGLQASFVIGGGVMVTASLAVAPWLREAVIEESLAAADRPAPPT